MLRKLALCSVVVVLVGCAKQPASIAPISTTGFYDNVSCERAKQLYNLEASRVPSLVSAQKSAVTGDALGVFLIGIPTASLTGGDKEGEIAVTKGKLENLSAKLYACKIAHTKPHWG